MIESTDLYRSTIVAGPTENPSLLCWSGFYSLGLNKGENKLATQKEAETQLIKAWACFQQGNHEDAAVFADGASDILHEAADVGFTDTDSPSVPRLRFKDWWIANPSRWFRRSKLDPSEPHTIVCESDVEELSTITKVRRTMKKIIGLIVISAAAGVGSNYLSSPFDGPTQLTRGLFAAVQQCEPCETIRSTDVAICTDCGSTKAIERIAAPLTHPWMGFFTKCHDGWQFKDGSTKFDDAGEYIVPELVVSKTMRM